MVDSIISLRLNAIQTLSGTVTQLVTDVEDNELDAFILKDATGEVLVDAEPELNLVVGESVTVVGESKTEDGTLELDALKITKADGSVILNPFETAGASLNDDIFDGTNKRDSLDGGQGRDFLKGRGGKDNLIGGNGADILIGGKGKDILTGGKGKDEFVYESLKDGGDRITDFKVKQDKLAVDELLVEDDLFELSNIKSLDQIADYVKLTQAGSRTIVKFDADGTAGPASFKVLATLEGVNAGSLSIQNFIVT